MKSLVTFLLCALLLLSAPSAALARASRAKQAEFWRRFRASHPDVYARAAQLEPRILQFEPRPVAIARMARPLALPRMALAAPLPVRLPARVSQPAREPSQGMFSPRARQILAH